MELKKSGLPIALEKNKLVFEQGLKEVVADIRTSDQMKTVLMQKKVDAPKDFYYMYRNVCKKEHEKKIFEHNLRFDITVIPKAKIGVEFVKTFGHFHPLVPNTNTHFPEVYEVIFGSAHFLLQKESDFIVVKASAGEKVIMPPGYGHITVNPGEQTLVMANWVEKNFKSLYGPIKEKEGAMYFETESGFVKNKNYKTHPKIRELTPINFEKFGLQKDTPMYSLVNKIEKLDFLKNPQNYLDVFVKFLKN